MAITTFKCPYCKRIINMTDGVQSRMKDIGNPLMKCQYCGGLIKTGAREWIDMPKSRKIEIWLKIHIAYGIIFGAVLGLAAWALIVEVLKKSNELGIALGIIVFIFIFYSMHRAYKMEIRESLKRKS